MNIFLVLILPPFGVSFAAFWVEFYCVLVPSAYSISGIQNHALGPLCQLTGDTITAVHILQILSLT